MGFSLALAAATAALGVLVEADEAWPSPFDAVAPFEPAGEPILAPPWFMMTVRAGGVAPAYHSYERLGMSER